MKLKLQLKHMKTNFSTWCAKRNELYSNILGEGDTFTNGDVVKANIYTVLGIAAIIFADKAVELLIRNFIAW